MKHDVDDCSVEVEKRLDRILVTSDLSERSRLLSEALAKHQYAASLAQAHRPLPRAGAEIIDFKAWVSRAGEASR